MYCIQESAFVTPWPQLGEISVAALGKPGRDWPVRPETKMARTAGLVGATLLIEPNAMSPYVLVAVQVPLATN